MRRPTRPLFLHPPVFHPLHPNIAPLLASTDSRSLANRTNMRRIYPPDLEGVRSVVYNRDHESKDATIRGIIRICRWPNNRIDQHRLRS